MRMIPQPSVALFVMFARSFVWQWLSLLDSWISYSFVISSTWTCTKKKGHLITFTSLFRLDTVKKKVQNKYALMLQVCKTLSSFLNNVMQVWL